MCEHTITEKVYYNKKWLLVCRVCKETQRELTTAEIEELNKYMAKESKYRIIKDFHTEGWHFDDGQFETVDEAVKKASAENYGNPFLIVKIIDWKAQEISS